jgi:dTDP-4-dehydrorhamnose 3,5-epimerase
MSGNPNMLHRHVSDSRTFGRWYGTELTESNNRLLWSAKGFAHGFQTLTDECLVAYTIGEFYDPEKARGVHWNDPDIAVAWPLPPSNKSARDEALPFLKDLDRALLGAPALGLPV